MGVCVGGRLGTLNVTKLTRNFALDGRASEAVI